MGRSKAIASGAAALVAAQFVIAVGQVAYAGVTARMLSAEDFAEFAVALNLLGMLNLVTTAGLASFTMSRSILDTNLVTKIRVVAGLSGLLLGAIYISVCNLWFEIFDAAGASNFALSLMIALAISPSCGVESALYRRDARSFLDAASMVLAFLAANGCAVVLILQTKQAWPLAMAPLLNPLVTMVWALVFRRTRFPLSRGPSAPVSKFVANVGSQSAVFFMISSIPLWALGVTVDLDTLGQYTRAAAITLLLATALNVAINRAVQPYWRHLKDPQELALGIRDGFVVTTWVSLTVFGSLAASGPLVVHLWLGQGWQLAGELSVVLALACALQVPTGMLTNALEMTGHFHIIRIAQLVCVAATALPIVALFATHNAFFAVLTSLVTQVSACAVMVVGASIRGVRFYRILADGFFREIILLSSPLVVAAIISNAIGELEFVADNIVNDVLKVVLVTISTILSAALAFKYSTCANILKRRISPKLNVQGAR